MKNVPGAHSSIRQGERERRKGRDRDKEVYTILP